MRTKTLFVFLLATGLACAQGVITTIAGTDVVFPAGDSAALATPLGFINGLAIDAGGNLLIADWGNLMVLRLGRDGRLRIAAGSGIRFSSGDKDLATRASLIQPWAVTADRSGNIYVLDRTAANVRKITPDGIIDTLFGGTTPRVLNNPESIGIDGAGNVYVADTLNNVIRRITPAGVSEIIAGSGVAGFSGDNGLATAATFGNISSIAVDSEGNVFLADIINARVRRVGRTDGIIRTYAGTGQPIPGGNGGPAAQAAIGAPVAIALDPMGNLYIADSSYRIRKVNRDGFINAFAGTGTRGYTGDGGLAGAANLDTISALAADAEGNVYLTDTVNQRIRRVSPDGFISTVAGNGEYRRSGDGGPATSAPLNTIERLAVDDAGNVFVADPFSSNIRRIAPDGTIRTVVGPGAPPPAPQDRTPTVVAIAVDGPGNLYYAANDGTVVMRRSPDGTFSRFAGTGVTGFAGDGGLAAQAVLGQVTSVATDRQGAVYVADFRNFRIRRIGSDGRIATVAGNGTQGFSGDGGPAIQASISFGEIAVDTQGTLYIATPDTSTAPRIRKVTAQGTISTFAGTGQTGVGPEEGPALNAMFNRIQQIAVDAAGNLYVTDSGNNRIRRITPAGAMTTVVGRFAGFSGDGGPADRAALTFPRAVAVDNAGNLYVGDTGNSRVRKVLATPPSFAIGDSSLRFEGRSRGAAAAVRRIDITGSIPGIAFQVRVSAPAPWLLFNERSGFMPRLLEVWADPGGLGPGTYQVEVTIFAESASPQERKFTVEFVVGAAAPPKIEIDQEQLSFTYPRNATQRSQSLKLTNSGSGLAAFRASVTTIQGGAWLRLTPLDGSVNPRTPVSLTVEANPAGLPPGTYRGTVQIESGETRAVPVTMTISSADTAILLSQTGLSFTAVSGGGIVPPQEFAVLNIGAGSMPWQASASTLSGGSSWLTLAPTSGTSVADSNAAPLIELRVVPEGLPPGRYHGLVSVTSAGAANSPQVLTVFLEVLPPDATPAAVLQPAELSFRGSSVPPLPGAKEFFVYNLTRQPVSYRTNTGTNGDIYQPRDATVDPRAPVRVVVQPIGVANGEITLQFSDGQIRKVALLKSGTTATLSRAADGCTAGRLTPSFISLGQASTVPAGWPAALVVDVKDDCGDPLDTGAVTVSFSNGDAPLALQSVRNGRWHGTWQSRNASSQFVTLRADATDPARGITGSRDSQANLNSTITPPEVSERGVVSVASPVSFTPLAQGGAISIFGENLTDGQTQSAAATPLPQDLAGSQVVMAGRRLPLYYSAQGQINALVPLDVEPNTRQQVLIRRGTTYSRPVPVNVAPAAPALFTFGGQGLAVVVRGASQFLNSADQPAQAGDTLVLYCVGLGPVNPTVPAGEAAPSSPLATVQQTVQLRVGGIDAPVQFAGLSPGFVGLYQLNAVLPAGVPKGAAVEVVLDIAGQLSPPVTLAIQ